MDYNGYKNRATWNVALWLGNDYGLYSAMCNYARNTAAERGRRHVTYRDFMRRCGLQGERTPDGFKYDGKTLDYRELTAVVRECLDD